MKQSSFRACGTIVFALSLSLFISVEVRGDDGPLNAYKAFTQARASADSIADIYPYLPAGQVEQLNNLPPETIDMFSQSIINSPNADRMNRPSGEIELVEMVQDGNMAKLFLRSESVDGGVRMVMTKNVDMIEEDGWKVVDPQPRSWRVTSRMPADPGAMPENSPPGMGSADWIAAKIVEPGQFVLVADYTTATPANPNKLRWDPNGKYVLVGTNSELLLCSVPELEPIWSGRVPTSFSGGTLSPDGQVMVTQDSHREPMAVYLGFTARYDADSETGFFEVLTLPGEWQVSGEVFNYLTEQYHPSNDVVALGVSGELGDAIAFYAVSEASSTAADITATDPQTITWSPDGSRLAWRSGFPDPGAAIKVSSYPDGDILHTLASPEIVPGFLMFSPDGTRLATVGGDGENHAVFVWDIGTGELISKIPDLRYASFGADSGQIIGVRNSGVVVEAGVNDTVYVHNVSSGAEEAALLAYPAAVDGLTAQITAIAVSPNGRYMATVATQDSETVLKLWEIASAP